MTDPTPLDVNIYILPRRTPMTEPRTGEESMAAALAPFGWTCGEGFWKRYHSDAWVFNLANAVERLSNGARLPDPRPTEAEVRKVLMNYWDWNNVTRVLRDLGCFRPEAGDPDA